MVRDRARSSGADGRPPAACRRAQQLVEGRLFEASADPRFAGAMLERVERRRRVRGQGGELIATAVPQWRELRGDRETPCEPRALKAEQSNSSVVYGDRLS